ncbi:Protein TIFY 10A [Apostasia shenzhenica]|uniref:Protein TIFY n=1 Tax=Apostasia shenzhenica TaxID=1088818 RepID=A0A2I0A9U2_9ASPA|nr:Protein TIFY 10A [Apostasia shenzhenica]
MASGAEAGRRPEKSSFSVTCSLLSQYIKEKGSLADLGLGVPARSLDSLPIGKSQAYRPPTTMSLLPGVEIADKKLGESKEDGSVCNPARSIEIFPRFVPISSPAEAKLPEKNQLTIFYGGKVLVFDNFPAEKANDLMQFASKSCNTAAAAAAAASAAATTGAAIPAESIPARAQPNFSNLPIARKASLHRFLEKRKDRITAKAPYQSSSSKDARAVKQEENSQPWLGLGPQNSKPGGVISDCGR